MSEQLSLDLPYRAAMGREDFFVSPGNAAAVAGIDGWRDWSFGKMVLAGPAGSGKTHLALVWAAQVGAECVAANDLEEARIEDLSAAPALVIEDADQIAGQPSFEELVFHLHNAMAARQAPLLLTARDAPQRWGIGLADLASRMSQSGVLRLEAPDDALLMAVLVKLAGDRGIQLTPKVIGFVLPRIERSFSAAQSFIAELDARALAEKRAPGFAIARQIIGNER